MPLVLVHNDVVTNPAHAWDDVEGVHYHYPSKYQSKIITGEPFVYYRGVHRLNGKRGAAEYVGSGRIGAIWPDLTTNEASRKAWYCAVEDYQRFLAPVPAKVDGVNLEVIPSNLWRDGVRTLDPAVYSRIMALSGQDGQTRPPPRLESQPLIITQSDQLIVPAAAAGPATGKSGYRKSKQAKLVGDWAEGVALAFIKTQIAGGSAWVHRAAGGETPGWDIDYLDQAGRLQRVEVKGTVGAAFTGVDITAGEMRAARRHREDYWLYLVAGCLTDAPKLQAIRDPFAFLEACAWTSTPTVYAVRFSNEAFDVS